MSVWYNMIWNLIYRMNFTGNYKLVTDREAWRAVIHGVTKSRTWLSDWTELNCSMLQMKVVQRLNPNSSNHKENIFFYLLFLYLYEVMNIH